MKMWLRRQKWLFARHGKAKLAILAATFLAVFLSGLFLISLFRVEKADNSFMSTLTVRAAGPLADKQSEQLNAFLQTATTDLKSDPHLYLVSYRFSSDTLHHATNEKNIYPYRLTVLGVADINGYDAMITEGSDFTAAAIDKGQMVALIDEDYSFGYGSSIRIGDQVSIAIDRPDGQENVYHLEVVGRYRMSESEKQITGFDDWQIMIPAKTLIRIIEEEAVVYDDEPLPYIDYELFFKIDSSWQYQTLLNDYRETIKNDDFSLTFYDSGLKQNDDFNHFRHCLTIGLGAVSLFLLGVLIFGLARYQQKYDYEKTIYITLGLSKTRVVWLLMLQLLFPLVFGILAGVTALNLSGASLVSWLFSYHWGYNHVVGSLSFGEMVLYGGVLVFAAGLAAVLWSKIYRKRGDGR